MGYQIFYDDLQILFGDLLAFRDILQWNITAVVILCQIDQHT